MCNKWEDCKCSSYSRRFFEVQHDSSVLFYPVTYIRQIRPYAFGGLHHDTAYDTWINPSVKHTRDLLIGLTATCLALPKKKPSSYYISSSRPTCSDRSCDTSAAVPTVTAQHCVLSVVFWGEHCVADMSRDLLQREPTAKNVIFRSYKQTQMTRVWFFPPAMLVTHSARSWWQWVLQV